jgi:hypothetical protein
MLPQGMRRAPRQRWPVLACLMEMVTAGVLPATRRKAPEGVSDAGCGATAPCRAERRRSHSNCWARKGFECDHARSNVAGRKWLHARRRYSVWCYLVGSERDDGKDDPGTANGSSKSEAGATVFFPEIWRTFPIVVHVLNSPLTPHAVKLYFTVKQSAIFRRGCAMTKERERDNYVTLICSQICV